MWPRRSVFSRMGDKTFVCKEVSVITQSTGSGDSIPIPS